MDFTLEGWLEEIRVLALDDEADARELVRDLLSNLGFKTMTLGSSVNLSEALVSFQPQVLLLDQGLPEKLGTDIIKEIRQSQTFKELPIIILSGRTGEDEKVDALAVGADDYVTKPFSPKELSARIHALLRRCRSKGGSLYEHKNLKVDLCAGCAMVDENELPLTLTEFKLLVELVTNKGRVLSREVLREKVIGKEEITDRTIDVHMAGLRKKMGELGREIRTVRGVGYRFTD